VKINFLTALTGQKTHEDLVKKSGGTFYFIKNLACGAFFS